jgi:hypothetical protein
MVMDRQKAIETIELLYPADSQYPDSAQIGKGLLLQAQDEVNNWRNEPTPVLIRYAQLCIELEQEQERMARRKDY